MKSAYRDREEVVMTNLKDMLNHEIGMLTTVVVGNSSTFFYDDLMITPRGYQRKYTLNQTEQPLRPHQRLRKEAEPWALDQEETVKQTASAIEDVQNTKEEKAASRALAEEALQAILGETTSPVVHQPIESIFEVAVSPGLANKKFTPVQMTTLAEVVGEKVRWSIRLTIKSNCKFQRLSQM